ncbi:MAG TPA: DNA polymerase III subunit delta [Blastocatellia bacterium]|nr:DNA polymerase III subunit delta [Blastocatellia bacterium]
MSRRPKKRLGGLDFQEFRRQVKQGQVEPLYLFAGAEQYYQETALQTLFATLDEAGRMFNNISTFRIDEVGASGVRVTAAAAIDAANQLPMMSARRIVVIRDFDKTKEGELDIILNYLKRPSPTSTVVFQAASLDQRRKLTGALLNACTVVTFDFLDEHEAARRARDFLKRRGCTIEDRTLEKLLGLVGTRLSRLVNELEKLATYTGEGMITLDAVERLVPRAREHSGLELWDAIVEGDPQRAIRLTHRLLDDGEEPVVLIGSLGGLYRRMLAGKELIARKAPQQELMKATAHYGPRLAAMTRHLARTSRGEIIRGLHRIAEVDNAIKNAEAPAWLQVEYLVAELVMDARGG